MPLNMTPLRLSVLRFLAEKPQGYNAKAMVADVCPRDTRTGYWTEQGLARMTGKILKPLIDAKLIRRTDWTYRMYAMEVAITEDGRALLAAHDSASSRRALDAAIRGAA